MAPGIKVTQSIKEKRWEGKTEDGRFLVTVLMVRGEYSWGMTDKKIPLYAEGASMHRSLKKAVDEVASVIEALAVLKTDAQIAEEKKEGKSRQ